MSMSMKHFVYLGAIFLLSVDPLIKSVYAQPQPIPVTVTQEPDGVLVKTGTDTLRLTVCGPTAVHVVSSPDGSAKSATPKQPWIVEPCSPAKFTLTFPKQRPEGPMDFDENYPWVATLDTGGIKVLISLASGSLRFTDQQDTRLLQEFPLAPRSYEPVMANGESLYAVSDLFYPLGENEALYGLGQHQNGIFNYRGATIPLAQVNTDVAIPLLVSTNGYGLLWNTAAKSEFDNRFATEMKLSAAAAHAIDYYFLYGPEMDQIVHQYRAMTGHVPLFGEWAYGYVQSKNSYASQAEVLKIANEYRNQHVPLDLIVQDATWSDHLGDPTFKPDMYPDVPAMLNKLHDEHMHAMVSVWGVFDTGTKNYQEMKAGGFIIPGTTDYDPTNPAARDYYWKNHVGKLFAQGWDAFWLDASEPERGMRDGHSDAVLSSTQLAIGNGALYANIYPLMHAENMYQHWRATTDRKRVMLLSRSGFAGMQRDGAFIWSGDIYSTYLTLQRQVPAGLNFALSGMPYWTTDIGGYGWPNPPRDTSSPEYQKLYLRWFEFGTFCPIFRAHGLRSNDQNEIFSYQPVTPTLISYDKLRYRLMPYIYSLAWKVTNEDGTIMRPLVMDWRTDKKVWNIGDQFMFGPSILVNPVTAEDTNSRSLYLPRAAAWYDFWTGKKTAGGQRIEAAAPLDRIPLYVKAGSILPLGPEIEYAGQNAGAAIELRIYPGADGSFDLYEDAGDSYDYEKGEHSVIPIRWNDGEGKLTLGARVGSFPTMTKNRSFHIVLVGENHGAGPLELPVFDGEINYSGEAVSAAVR
jgi:alpha-D-xyloside xylohydrolase